MCGACHDKKNPRYSEAVHLYQSCDKCHGKLPEYTVLMGEGRDIKITVKVTGASEEEANASREYFSKQFENSGFNFSDNAALEISFVYEVKEVQDSRVIPADSKTKLYRGTCVASIMDGGKTVFERILESKVISGEEPKYPQYLIVYYLTYQSYVAITGPLDEAVSVEEK